MPQSRCCAVHMCVRNFYLVFQGLESKLESVSVTCSESWPEREKNVTGSVGVYFGPESAYTTMHKWRGQIVCWFGCILLAYVVVDVAVVLPAHFFPLLHNRTKSSLLRNDYVENPMI